MRRLEPQAVAPSPTLFQLRSPKLVRDAAMLQPIQKQFPLPSPYYSRNGWIAQVDHDTIILSSLYHGKGKFLVAGWNPLGRRCVPDKIFNTPEDAQAWIESLDPLTRHINFQQLPVRVFIACDGNYWWYIDRPSDRPQYQNLGSPQVVYSMEHATRLVASTLLSLEQSDDIPF